MPRESPKLNREMRSTAIIDRKNFENSKKNRVATVGNLIGKLKFIREKLPTVERTRKRLRKEIEKGEEKT